ncbi:hypothetical protein SAMN05443144_113141 [Fodinibius roseus]|uniref:Uncharacterized protein n=1 Tax=Fodinibius roseus TaxID=1194090 RepID=A0A1M5ERG2_9BACT|nr:hypothetical protein SAMN05443144_113141 [Fodinibius roseus]
MFYIKSKHRDQGLVEISSFNYIIRPVQYKPFKPQIVTDQIFKNSL